MSESVDWKKDAAAEISRLYPLERHDAPGELRLEECKPMRACVDCARPEARGIHKDFFLYHREDGNFPWRPVAKESIHDKVGTVVVIHGTDEYARQRVAEMRSDDGLWVSRDRGRYFGGYSDG